LYLGFSPVFLDCPFLIVPWVYSMFIQRLFNVLRDYKLLIKHQYWQCGQTLV
jgi:hypothetical protein